MVDLSGPPPEGIPADHPSMNGNHEDSDMHESLASPAAASPPGVLPADKTSVSHEEDTVHLPEKTPSSKDSAAAAPKSPVKVPAGKALTSVKKIPSSGTSGSVTVKPTASKATVLPAKPASVASPVKKFASGPQQPAKSSMPLKSTAPAVATPPSRRSSLAPTPKTPGTATTKTPLSTKPPSRLSIVPSSDSNASLRSSTTARPRASVTEGVKRTLSMSKPGTPPVARPPSASPATTKLTRTPGPGSISSISEAKINEKTVELQQKLDDATASLLSRDATIAGLESQATEAKAALDVALGELEARRNALEQLQQVRTETGLKLEQAQNSLHDLRVQRENDDSASMLAIAQTELQTTNATLLTEKDAVNRLQTQVETLESQVAKTRAELEALQSSSETASKDTAAAAAVEHEALVKAKADLDSIRTETENLKAAHAQTLEEVSSKVGVLENRISDLANVEAELASSKREREENANRISELEIEVLEAKESVERAEDEQTRATARTKSLEGELAKSTTASELVLKAKEDEHASQVEVIRKQHSEELTALKTEQESLSSQLIKLEGALADAQVSLEQARAEHLANSEEHTAAIQLLEQSHQGKLAELDAELQRVSNELEDQENIYNAKVDGVKEEHEIRLQDAFQRANDKHGSDLQSLRAESQQALEQVRSGYEESIQTLKVEHAAALDEQVKILEKQISNQNLELKATQEDLTKAKTALSLSLQEFESVNSQLEEARRSAEAMALSASQDQANELAQLTKELSNAKEDRAALEDVLAAQKESFTEMSDNHAKELEEAAKGRAEEVTKLRAVLEAEIAALSKNNSDLAVKLSDVEGEVATLKAAMATEPVSAPKSNGAAQASSTGVTKEEIQRVHEAHNLKMNDMQAEFEKTVKALKEDLGAARAKTSELELEVDRKTMEISYLEQDQEENQDQITRLKEDIDHLHKINATE